MHHVLFERAPSEGFALIIAPPTGEKQEFSFVRLRVMCRTASRCYLQEGNLHRGYFFEVPHVTLPGLDVKMWY